VIKPYSEVCAFQPRPRDGAFFIKNKYSTTWGRKLGEWAPSIRQLGIFIEEMGKHRKAKFEAEALQKEHDRQEKVLALQKAQEVKQARKKPSKVRPLT
jgi:hypothetical protein